MSDEADRPLTRRERRMREMADSQEVPVTSGAEPRAEAPRDEPPSGTVEDSLDISPLNPDGTLRTRREMRILRQRALAAQESAAGDSAPEPEASDANEGGSEASDPQAPDMEQSLEQHLETAETGLPIDLEQTQPFSHADLQLIAQDQANAEAAAEASEADANLEALLSEFDSESEVEELSSAPEMSDDGPATTEKGYTFPDIAPLDESVSVFDEPSGTVAEDQHDSADNGEFDELISRAVAQEGAASATNSSALILPNLPETGELAGPLGDTGELFITGSIELPKSLGETGSHAPLHEIVESDALGELGFDEIPVKDDANLPVSATRAVSAVSAGDTIVAQETKEKNKLPLVLILTGGGLVIAVGALLIWGASAGMFG